MHHDASGVQSSGASSGRRWFESSVRSGRKTQLPAGLITMLIGIASVPALGFQVRFQVEFEGSDATWIDDRGLVAIRDRDAESWLTRAEKAAAREDWKLAADTLARVINGFGHKTVSLDGEHFYSAGWCAQRQLQDWPDEGIATYRVLYDGEAERLFELGRRTHDLHPLRSVAYRYPLTTIGPAALDLLASWLLDRNEAMEAIDVLHSLSALRQNRISRQEILAKLAVAYTLSDQRKRAVETFSEMSDLVARLGVGDVERARDRLEALQRFFEATKFDRGGALHQAQFGPWSQLLGPPAAAGQAPPINPIITSDLPWRDALPGTSRVDVDRVRTLTERNGRPPVWQAVTDGSLLFVATPGGLVARDLATFEFLWQSIPSSGPRDPRIEAFRIQTNFFGGDTIDESERLDALTTRALYHEYAGAVTTAMGLVFAIDQAGTAGEVFPERKRGRVEENNTCTSGENSLRAFEASTGRSVWTKGRAGPVEDELKEAHFYSTPVVAGRYLVAPYELRHELLLAVIEPDGTLVRKISLGSGRPGMLPFNAVLQPTVVDGTIYIPTGGGLLIALNAADFSLRWLTTYERSNMFSSVDFGRQQVFIAGMTRLRAYSQPDEWLCSPPVVSRGLVLLAPHDSESLLAFDRATGEGRWQFDRDRHRYIVGANDRVVIIAGRKVTAVDLETGKAAWSFDEHRPTGRPALSGDRVLVSTTDGLVVLNVDDGKPVGDVARSESVLGNLLVADGALFSISVNDIAKFPDPVRTRELAERRLARNPDDLDAIVRLAWLAGLEDDWARALSLIEPITSDGDDARISEWVAVDAGRRERVSHLRVSALLALAGEAQSASRIKLLADAVSAARRPDDVVRAGLEYCDSLVEQGNDRLAIERGMAMLVDVGDAPVHLEDGLDGRASILIAERLRRFDRSISNQDRAALFTRLREVVESALKRGDTVSAGRLVDSVPWHDASARADLRLAGVARSQGRLETAAFHLERAVRRAPGTDIAAEVLARQALLLASPGDGLPAAPSQARSVMRQLKAEYTGRSLPDRVFSAVDSGGGGNVDAFVAALERLPTFVAPSESGRRAASDFDRGKLYVEYEECDTTVDRQTRVFYDSYCKDDGWGAVLPVKFSEQVKGVRIDSEKSGGHCWSNEVNPRVELEQMASVGFGGFPGPLGSAPVARSDPETRCAAISGRVAVLDLGNEIHAIGLTTGRSMWRPMAVNRELGALPEPSVLAVAGMIIASVDAHTLVGIPARQDAAPLWRRRFDKRRMGRLAKVDGYAVVIDMNAQWLWVVDPTSGRIVREFSLLVGDKRIDSSEQVAEGLDPDARVALAGGAICRNGHKRVVARDIVTGRVLWEKPFLRRVLDLTTLDDHHVAVSHGIDHFTVMRVETGEIIKELELEDLELPPIGATLDWPDAANRLSQGRLLIFAKTDDDPPRYKIVSHPLDDSEVWENGPYDHAMISPRMLTASSSVLPLILYDVGAKSIEREDRSELPQEVLLSAMVLLDKSNLERIGRYFEFDGGWSGELGTLFGDPDRSKMITDVVMIGDRFVAVTPDGFCILAKRESPGDVSVGESGGIEDR